MDEDVGEIGVTERVEPVFFLNNEVDQEDGNYLETYVICMAVCEVVGNANRGYVVFGGCTLLTG